VGSHFDVRVAEQTAHPKCVRAGGRVLPQMAVLKSVNSRFRTCMSSSMRWRSGVMAISCERAWSSPGMHTEHMWGIQSIRTAGKPRSLNLDGMLALPLPRSGLVQAI
jgi:hypothetical protein